MLKRSAFEFVVRAFVYCLFSIGNIQSMFIETGNYSKRIILYNIIVLQVTKINSNKISVITIMIS